MSDLIDRDYMLSQIEKAKAENRPFDYDSLIDFVKVLPNANNEVMNFPKTFKEFEKYYGFTDTEEVYTNGIRLIPVFRVEQWLEHIKEIDNDLL